MTEALEGIGEDVPFSGDDAEALITACQTATAVLEDQHGHRSAWRAIAGVEFRGYYADLFTSNGAVQLRDSENLVSALRTVAE
ncbi:MAG: hypothetical protein LBI84_01040, partial [Propionibacteriaceae bacterium]|nr:hypothetical protein [Propionibacteriaceae bacterium]